MKAFKYNVLGMVCFVQLVCTGQTVFDTYYTTGYHNNKSSNVIARSDSDYVFVNYIIDSASGRMDMGLLKLDKYGNEVIKNSFNMFNQSYYNSLSGMKNFIGATASSYFLMGTYFVGNNQGFILTKLNRSTLDTIKNVIYSDNYSYGINNFIKFNDNKYYLVGNRWLGNNQYSIIFKLDSNLNILQTINVPTSINFGIWNATYNPVTEKILLAGGTASGQYLNTFVHIDTLGTISETRFGSKYYQYKSIVQMHYSSLDSTYIAIGYLRTGVFSNIGLTKLCISKYDVNLNLKWEKTYGEAKAGNGLVDGVVLNDGSIVVSGAYSPKMSAPSPLVNNTNGVILKVDKNGNFKWAREFDHVPVGSLVEMFYGIDKTLDKGFILCGNIIGPPTNKSKAWAVKTDSMGCVTPGCPSSVMQVDSIIYPPIPVDTTTVSTIGIEEKMITQNKLHIYPNPVDQILKVELLEIAAAEKRKFDLVIVNVFGQIALNYKSDSTYSELEVETLKDGIYFLQVFNKNVLIGVAKFVKE